jgi:hypothetical protein
MKHVFNKKKYPYFIRSYDPYCADHYKIWRGDFGEVGNNFCVTHLGESSEKYRYFDEICEVFCFVEENL